MKEESKAWRIFIKIQGKTSHGAAPHLGINALDAAAQAVIAVQAVCGTRFSGTIHPILLDAGKGAINMIPDHVDLALEWKGYCEKYLQEELKRIKETVSYAVETVGASLKSWDAYDVIFSEEKEGSLIRGKERGDV